MTDKELLNRLKEMNALVVHFSHHANMREGGIFPDDMQCAIANKDNWALSCCVIWPDHSMNLPGSVGIIFKPTVANVLSVCNSDAGSSEINGTELSGGVMLDQETFEATFKVVGSYNEWRVKGAEVFGMFVANPSEVYVKKLHEIEIDCHKFEEIGMSKIDLEEVIEYFPDLDIYTITKSGIVKITN